MPMEFYPTAQAYDVLPPKISESAYLGDTMTSKNTDAEHTITSGFFKFVDGEPLVYTYPYDEMKICLESVGDITISDEEGTTVRPKKGDTLYLKKGATITFKAVGPESYARFFYTGLKALNEL
jgi:ethanolamine utilization protein EutQ (cupin superfamily)